MKKNTGKFAIILVAVIWASAGLSACKKTPEAVEIDRTFEYTTGDTQPVLPTTQPEPSTTEPTQESETDTEGTSKKEEETSTTKPSETAKPVQTTTAECAETYFGNKNSVFNTLPLFEKGKFEEHFDKVYVEGIRFSGTEQADFDNYLKTVLNAGKYALNSQDGNRAYLANSEGTMCVTLLYKDGIMLIEAGKSYWDIFTFAEETQEPTKPAETTDSRYGYFDNKDLVFSELPYFTAGIFTGYEAVDRGGKLTFSSVSEQDYDAYTETLLANMYMSGGTLPGGTVTYFTNDKVVITATYEDSVLTLQAVYN